jgi:antirestriction protein ArdC
MKPTLDIYAKVTTKIIADLERGNLTWLKPWQAGNPAGDISLPRRSCGKAYRGINVVMLWASAVEQGFNSPLWITYKQAAELGAQVRKGEKGSPVVYADSFKKTGTDTKGEDVETTIPFLKAYTVFNAEQVDGLPEHFYTSTTPISNDQPRIDALEQFFTATGAVIRHGGSKAYYSPSQDCVQMPEFAAFRDGESYYATLAHEITHWTSHPSRLDRQLGGKRFGDAGYAMEELVAELGAAFLCAELAITPETREDHAAYIATWLKVLRHDKRAIFTAASHAQRAADHLRGYRQP